METVPGSPSGAEAPTPARPRRSLKMYVVVLVVLVALAGFAVWWVYFKPYTIEQLFGMARDCQPDSSLCQFSPGQTVYVAGTVTRIRLVDVSTGPHTELTLDGSGVLLFAGDRRTQFAVGTSTTIPLVIRAYRYNGIEYRSADEFALVPTALAFSSVMMAISRVSGITFLPASTGPGAVTLEVAAHKGEAFPLSRFRFCLIDVQGPLFLGESGSLGCEGRDEIDTWTPTGNGSSPGGRMAFVDLAGNGRLDVGDRITITARPASAPYDLDSEMLAVNNMTSGILGGLFYWFETTAGMVYYPDPLSVTPTVLEMWSPLPFVMGPPDVDPFQLVVAQGISPALGNLSYVARDQAGNLFAQGTVAAGTFLSAGGMTGRYDDRDGDGHASLGDRLEFLNGQPDAHYTFQLVSDSTLVAQLDWVSGRGAYTGSFPLVAFPSVTQIDAATLEASVVLAGGYPWEEVANFTLELREGATLLVSVDLRTATNGTAGGQTLRFVAGGDPTHLDAGDVIRVEGLRTGVQYTVRVLHTPYTGLMRVCGEWAISN